MTNDKPGLEIGIQEQYITTFASTIPGTSISLIDLPDDATIRLSYKDHSVDDMRMRLTITVGSLRAYLDRVAAAGIELSDRAAVCL